MEVPGTANLYWVARQTELNHLSNQLMQSDVVGVDTESNSLFAYQEQVCLLQFSTRESDYLIDPLGLPDLTSIGPLFADPQIEKVFHAAEYDLICMKRDFGFTFNNLFDTMLAARILGRSGLGLGTLLEEEFNMQVDKRYQRANWTRRPISPEMMNYARMDTHFLIPLRNLLREQLIAANRLELAEEDFRRLTQVAAAGNHDSAAGFWRIGGSQDLSPRQAAVLQELVNYREERARSANLPPFRIFSNQTLLELAQRMPRRRSELNQVYGLTPKIIDRHAPALLAAIERGILGPPAYRPAYHRPSDSVLYRLEMLRNWRKATARAMGVESDVILPRDIMEDIASRDPRTMEELGEVMKDIPWRLEHFGKQILSLLNQ